MLSASFFAYIVSIQIWPCPLDDVTGIRVLGNGSLKIGVLVVRQACLNEFGEQLRFDEGEHSR